MPHGVDELAVYDGTSQSDIFPVQVDPSAGAGIASDLGSVALFNDTADGQIWYKHGTLDTDWSRMRARDGYEFVVGHATYDTLDDCDFLDPGDGTGIQAALDASTGGIATIFVRRGTYTLAASLTFSGSTLVLHGAMGRGGLHTVISWAGAFHAITMTTVGVGTASIDIQGIGANSTSTSTSFVYSDLLTRLHIRNCSINFTNAAVGNTDAVLTSGNSAYIEAVSISTNSSHFVRSGPFGAGDYPVMIIIGSTIRSLDAFFAATAGAVATRYWRIQGSRLESMPYLISPGAVSNMQDFQLIGNYITPKFVDPVNPWAGGLIRCEIVGNSFRNLDAASTTTVQFANVQDSTFIGNAFYDALGGALISLDIASGQANVVMGNRAVQGIQVASNSTIITNNRGTVTDLGAGNLVANNL